MEHTENQSQSLSICNRIYNFITRSLSTHALKTVILGHPVRYEAKLKSPSQDPFASDGSASKGHDHNCKCQSLSTVEDIDIKIHGEDGNASSAAAAVQPRPLKKAVSINDSVEEIDAKKQKKLKRKKSCEDEPKPLRSVLKVGSNLDGKSNSLANLLGMDQS